MTLYGRSKWVAALALGLAGLIGVGAATVSAAPARTAASAFELTLDETLTMDDDLEVRYQGTFSSGAPFCGRGTIVHPLSSHGAQQLACDDGTRSLTVSIAPGVAWRPGLGDRRRKRQLRRPPRQGITAARGAPLRPGQWRLAEHLPGRS
jgi:hypothetical protein